MIKIKNLVKTYGEKNQKIVALNNISLNLPENKFITIIGKSGSGKTTFLNMLGLIDKWDNGEIYVDDVSIGKFRNKEKLEYRRNMVGIVFQFFDLIPVLNVRDNIMLANKNSNRCEKKYFDYITEVLEIKDLLYRYPNQISGGQKQRVAIARAIINKPKILLADEPTGNLDSNNSQKVIELLKKISMDNNMTLIIVTHDNDIKEMSDYSVCFEDGNIVEEGYNDKTSC